MHSCSLTIVPRQADGVVSTVLVFVDFLSVLVFVTFFVAFFVGTGSGAAKMPVIMERMMTAD